MSRRASEARPPLPAAAAPEQAAQTAAGAPPPVRGLPGVEPAQRVAQGASAERPAAVPGRPGPRWAAQAERAPQSTVPRNASARPDRLASSTARTVDASRPIVSARPVPQPALMETARSIVTRGAPVTTRVQAGTARSTVMLARRATSAAPGETVTWSATQTRPVTLIAGWDRTQRWRVKTAVRQAP